MKPVTTPRQRLKTAIAKRLHWRREALNDARAVSQSRSLKILRTWQTQRLKQSFKDVLGHPQMRPAAEFFLSDLYSDKDFTSRDRDIDKIMPVMVHVLPEAMLSAARDAIELHALSQALDARMAEAMGKRNWDTLDESRYGELYREVGLPRCRHRQIDLVVKVGQSLDAAVAQHGLHKMLKFSRIPAMAAGLSELQQFLERGFDAFEKLKGAKPFLDRVEIGEKQVSQRLIRGSDQPFGWGSSPQDL